MYTSMIFIMIIISIIMLVVTISLLKRKNWECFYIENEILYLPSLFVKEIPLSNIRNIEFVKAANVRYIESIDSNIKMGILLASNKEKNMEPIIYEIGIDGESGRDYYSHGNSEEFIYILEGELEVYVANKKYKLAKGDSLYFKSSLNHRFKNTSKKEVKALWVVSPPTF